METIKRILNQYLDVPEEKLKEETLPLTGEYFGLPPRDMVYLLFLIEKEFKIRIEINEMINYEFSTIEKISLLIKKKQCNQTYVVDND